MHISFPHQKLKEKEILRAHSRPSLISLAYSSYEDAFGAGARATGAGVGRGEACGGEDGEELESGSDDHLGGWDV